MEDELDALRKRRIEELKKQAGQQGSAKVLSIDEMQFHDLLATRPFLVVDFWAEWCGPCRMVGPVIETIAGELGDTVTFAKCNTDENPRIAASYSITAIPTIMLFAKGQLVDRIIGAYPKETMRSRVIRAFGLKA
jgi:thioredoxin 1